MANSYTHVQVQYVGIAVAFIHTQCTHLCVHTIVRKQGGLAHGQRKVLRKCQSLAQIKTQSSGQSAKIPIFLSTEFLLFKKIWPSSTSARLEDENGSIHFTLTVFPY